MDLPDLLQTSNDKSYIDSLLSHSPSLRLPSYESKTSILMHHPPTFSTTPATPTTTHILPRLKLPHPFSSPPFFAEKDRAIQPTSQSCTPSPANRPSRPRARSRSQSCRNEVPR
ncbi:hypothetical protein K432DRAFT_191574 [Lepidopterella palustris CBS 459.81]|uniref:Uncharacterized protein n=1 Tax=Lepidopterella palustris CBS 459.81 TaxID=1314670 RepID=A0A8E2DZT0_9PEZI|nr:hypothetical protein K432DRAFT_191574 [Lepidopterella palustris CBS 459.81]